MQLVVVIAVSAADSAAMTTRTASPGGYRLHSINYMAKGLCPQCAAEKH